MAEVMPTVLTTEPLCCPVFVVVPTFMSEWGLSQHSPLLRISHKSLPGAAKMGTISTVEHLKSSD